MCLIVFAWKVEPHSPLLACANRDEFFARASAPAHHWAEQPNIYAGRDLQSGGTWMGITSNNRFATTTNIRTPAGENPDARSRGHLVSDYLSSDISPQAYIQHISRTASNYNGFNLLVGDQETLIWYSNRGHGREENGQALKPGIYALANALLDDPWPKVTRVRAHFDHLLRQQAEEKAYLDMLADTTRAPDEDLPDTNFDLETKRMLSSIFVASPHYGTRSSTLVRLHTCKPPILKEKIFK